MCFPNFGAARTPYLMYDVYTNDRLHGICFPGSERVLKGISFCSKHSYVIRESDFTPIIVIMHANARFI